MLPFDYRGRDWREKNRFRRLLLALIVSLGSILLFPFTLLALLLWSLWQLAGPNPARTKPG